MVVSVTSRCIAMGTASVHSKDDLRNKLTPLQDAVLLLYVAECSYREIAAKLDISVPAVKKCLCSIANRLGVHGRRAIRAHVHQKGDMV